MTGSAAGERGAGLGVVLLAAGQGRRMGGPNKLLADLRGAPVVARAADALVDALPEATRVVVTGRDAEAVAAVLAGRAFRPAFNPDAAAGMGGSLARGVAALPMDLDGILIALADMPGLAPATVRRLVAAWRAAPETAWTIARPRLEAAGAAGHPVLWGAAWRPALAALTGDRGGRDLLAGHPDRVMLVAVADPAIRRDIDTPADLAAARAGRR